MTTSITKTRPAWLVVVRAARRLAALYAVGVFLLAVPLVAAFRYLLPTLTIPVVAVFGFALGFLGLAIGKRLGFAILWSLLLVVWIASLQAYIFPRR